MEHFLGELMGGLIVFGLIYVGFRIYMRLSPGQPSSKGDQYTGYSGWWK